MGNLAKAKRLAAENRVNDIFRSRIALYEGDWKAAEEKLEPGSRLGTNRRHKVNQLITLGNMVPLLRVAGDYERATAAFERARSLYPPDDLFLELGMRSQAVMLCVDSGRPGKGRRTSGVLPGGFSQNRKTGWASRDRFGVPKESWPR